MIGYVLVGTNDLPKATQFYDAVLVPLGLTRVVDEPAYAGYAPVNNLDAIELYVTIPLNDAPATIGNGSMIALAVTSFKQVDQFHQIGIDLGGMDEGAPGFRPADGKTYFAYVRDMDGNKICAFCSGDS
ncbi:VOC family protein [bacterium]|jgi:catechol 2,3-dioxygenase-like lactoylglutathione lyase family enzyme|nr:VOC family protein [bacterium]